MAYTKCSKLYIIKDSTSCEMVYIMRKTLYHVMALHHAMALHHVMALHHAMAQHHVKCSTS